MVEILNLGKKYRRIHRIKEFKRSQIISTLPSAAVIFSQLKNILIDLRWCIIFCFGYFPLQFFEAEHLGLYRIVLPFEEVEGGQHGQPHVLRGQFPGGSTLHPASWSRTTLSSTLSDPVR